MKVRECRDGVECIVDEDRGVIILCPVCSDVWLSQDESTGSCEHIRFLYSGFTDFLFFGDDWDHASFEKSFWKLCEQGSAEQAFNDLNHPDFDAVVYWVPEETMGSGYAFYWGYKE